MNPDEFFTAKQIRRLEELFASWRVARENHTTLSPSDQAELDALIEAEWDGMIERSKRMLGCD